ncbi:Helicase associated domain protein [Streptomyces rubiginosohelvolus]|uniref:DEAD/DEAH box helicase n=1 Tax=Streptomyces TaxID=1883 RepID=UPI000BF1301B|nr:MULTISPECIES: DEAD/DEAH box helicase [unclassified Streptomyces]RDL05144.1 helicase associated protein [Streptomyces sp. HB202]
MTGRAQLRPHQEEAVAAGVHALLTRHLAAATIVAACGTGKTLIGKRIAEHIPSNRPVLVLVPTLELLLQTAARWLADGKFDQLIGVCSLPGVHDRHLRGHLWITGDPHALVRRITQGGRTAVFATYSSLRTIAEAHRVHGLPRWDFALADEAHRTSGDWDKKWGLIHDDRAIPVAHRLYMTATPRNWRPTSTKLAKARPRLERLASMDDPTVYGPTVYKLDLADAIERGILADYQLIVPEIRDKKLLKILQDELPTPHLDGLRIAAMQAGLLTAMAEHDARQVLTFHARIAAARGFADTLPQTAGILAHHTGIHNPWSHALYHQQPTWQRQLYFREFGHFSALAPGSAADTHDAAVLASVRVLSEGVDAPHTDGIFIADPRRTPSSIAQTIGRGLRKPAGQDKCASIFLPVYTRPDQTTQEAMTSSQFSEIWKFFNGLAVYDSKIFRRFGKHSRARPQPIPARPTRVADVSRALELRTHRPRNNAYWDLGWQAAQAFREQHNHLNVPSEYVASNGLALGQWIGQQRSLHATGALSADRTTALTFLGISWPHPPESFEHHLGLATASAARHGTLALGKHPHAGDRATASWLETMRRRADIGELAPARIAALDAVDPFWNPPWSLRWQYTYVQIRRRLTTTSWRCTYHPDHCHDSSWDTWLDRQITQHDLLDPQQKHLLDTLARACHDAHPHSMLLTRPTSLRARAFNHGLRAARRYHLRHGNLNVPAGHIEDMDGASVALGAWLGRRQRGIAQMTPPQRTALEVLDARLPPMFLPPVAPAAAASPGTGRAQARQFMPS